MKWRHLLERDDTLKAFYSQDPTLNAVEMIDVTLDYCNSVMSMTLNVSKFPDRVPDKWRKAGFNQAQMHWTFSEINSISIEGIGLLSVVDIDLHGASGHVTMRATGNNTMVSVTCRYFMLTRISGYVKNPEKGDSD